MASFDDLIAAGDAAELLITVDRLVAAQDWDGLVRLSALCNHAVEVGRQLWPIAMHIDYRLALEAPGRLAAAVCTPGAAKFALGPLTEVVASRHAWEDLDRWLPHPATRAAVVQERAIRGEDLRHVEANHELPPVRYPFETCYALPSYEDRRAGFPEPPVAVEAMPAPAQLSQPETVAVTSDDACHALSQVVGTWTSSSRGTVRTVRVVGSAEQAVAALSSYGSLRQIDPAEAMAMLQWAGASGGAHGLRPGGAAGRFSAWWAAAALAGLEWPEVADENFAHEVAAALEELDFHRFTTPTDQPGWALRLAIADPLDGLAWAIEAFDSEEQDDAASDGETRDEGS